MTVFEIVFLGITMIWLVEFALFRNRMSSTDEGKLERKSFPYILLAVGVTIVGTLMMRETEIGVIHQQILWWAGLVLYGYGVFLRYYGILHLREQFTRDVSVREGDRLVSSGPYQRLRHPLYTGLLFIVVGFCLGVGNVWTAVVGGGWVALTLLHRIRIEEAMLIDAHGKQYREWCEGRYRLIPFVY
ncbi:isoprenylcysteine carboxyl methyltransferase [Halobacillus andaensis]|uniref:Isoprenylcysteine carboxyl methyltransferase n=1 Tax=Halobacillus andaensis TaxID=1176239 RepID=A0A917F0Y0_HALAA|nr:isoprenylcysteine carboxylmethyltransferase family protein [Halobacillus andaensis]MBP2006274.1 protein-S-isoprenylcysteine O-methyltransferase Ste14 [Halobacillus andaensis]GGF33920.1 isoprenylcysteine carboxyl methyltransferase [Halobacillus andaensis]